MSSRQGRDDEKDAQSRFKLLPTGAAGLTALIRAIDRARHNVQLQTYIYQDDQVGSQVRSALVAAAVRGVRVRVLLDALGSYSLPNGFFDALRAAGGECHLFNPLHPRRIIYRQHRKALICDRSTAIVGGFNIADDYNGDGVETGWYDMGIQVWGGLANDLVQAFDRLFLQAAAGDHPRRFARFYLARRQQNPTRAGAQLLLGGPGLSHNPLKAALIRDFGRAGSLRIASAYFLPTWRLRRKLMKLARRGGRVQLLLAGKTDVAMAQHAGHALYSRLLRAGVEIFEYQPQILHAKLFISDQTVYIGSANFNTRSLHIDFELMLRIENDELSEQAHGLFDYLIDHSERIDEAGWRRHRNLWARLKQRVSYYLMARLDPLLARWLWKGRG
ncbi:MAG: phospholipase D-like domain-containing protein [Wenzhouxiangella sp.]